MIIKSHISLWYLPCIHVIFFILYLLYCYYFRVIVMTINWETKEIGLIVINRTPTTFGAHVGTDWWGVPRVDPDSYWLYLTYDVYGHGFSDVTYHLHCQSYLDSSVLCLYLPCYTISWLSLCCLHPIDFIDILQCIYDIPFMWYPERLEHFISVDFHHFWHFVDMSFIIFECQWNFYMYSVTR